MYNAVNSFMIALALVHFSKKKKKRNLTLYFRLPIQYKVHFKDHIVHKLSNH